ncbi:hypothetical protein FJ444_12045 [Aestuariibacter sp. GS-14]|uniref:tetratricopeptide repeat protein n=1 Tax=Aestuariibacter sp. GS-14 TaxID=2590670 RepID=UPI00112CBE8C|nr:hypothetical protein [Aestuariibacter sp. GS-14]TPV57888.1 hypothetical protein FJ444_12045 [Aestuariibacter sp. GS-14]
MSVFKTTRHLLFAAVALLSCSAHALPNTDNTSIEVLTEHAKQGDFEYVISVLEAVKGKTVEQYNLLISALMNTDPDDAEDAAEEFITAHSKDYRAYHMHASVMGAQASNSIFSALGYASKAKQSLETAVELAPDNVEVYQALMQFHLMAPSIAGGDMKEAEKLTDKIASIDPQEGQFAKATYYLQDKQEDKASAIYTALIAQDDTKIRAGLELGTHYLLAERYSDAFNVLSVLLTAEVNTVDDKASDKWDAYEENTRHLLYGKYRLGLLAVKSGENTQTGIAALEQYISEYTATNIDTASLPGLNWAYLRLAELQLNINEIIKAKLTLASIKGEDDKRFASLLSDLKKQIKKKA